MPCDAGQIRVFFQKMLEDFVLLFVGRLERNPVLPVAQTVIAVILPEMIRFNAEQDIDIGQALGAEIPGLFPGPERGTEVAVKGHGQPLLMGNAQHVKDQTGTVGRERGRYAAQVQPVKVGKQVLQVHLGKIKFGDGGMLPVIDDLTGADAVAGFQIIASQPVGRGLLGRGQNHRRAVHIIGTQPAHGTFSQSVVRHHGEKGGIDPKIGQCHGDIGLTAAVAGLEGCGHADFLIVWRGQTEHDFSGGNEAGAGIQFRLQRILMKHNAPPGCLMHVLYRFQGLRSMENALTCTGNHASISLRNTEGCLESRRHCCRES